MSDEKWSDETDKRPAPVVLACASGMAVMVASAASLKTLYGVAVILGLLSIQVTLWRCANRLREKSDVKEQS